MHWHADQNLDTELAFLKHEFSNVSLYEQLKLRCLHFLLFIESVFCDGDQVQVKCSLIYMDFEGRSDGRSIKSILAHVCPLKLVRKFPCACQFTD